MTDWDGKSKLEKLITRRDELKLLLRDIERMEYNRTRTIGRLADRVFKYREGSYGFLATQRGSLPEFTAVPKTMQDAFADFLIQHKEAVEAELQELLGTLEVLEAGLA